MCALRPHGGVATAPDAGRLVPSLLARVTAASDAGRLVLSLPA
jgi:hypothetical protein